MVFRLAAGAVAEVVVPLGLAKVGLYGKFVEGTCFPVIVIVNFAESV
jgi:hypothetical protein